VIYVEFISRNAGVEIGEFHLGVKAGQEGWAEAHPEDQLIWCAARTWRLGPEPEYVAVWHTPQAGFERIDEWEEIFRSGTANHFERPARAVSRIDRAGCYRPLVDPTTARGGVYYAEFFRATGSLDAVRTFYEGRRRHRDFTLNLLAHRIGRLGPEPGGLAVWTVPRFAALAELADELDAVDDPIELVTAGVYADVGQEIL
jgi:hypothetical protein